MAQTFTAQISAFVAKCEKRVEAVFRGSAQDLAAEMREPIARGGKLPLVTGNLRRSLMASTASMPSVSPSGTVFAGSEGAIEAVIAGAQIGQTIFLGWSAAYARRMEYGFVGTDALGRTYNQAGFGFTRAAAQNWGAIVDRNAAKAVRAFP